MYRNWHHAYQEQGNVQLIFLKKQQLGVICIFFGLFLFITPFFVKSFYYVYPLVVNNIKGYTSFDTTSIKQSSIKIQTPPTHILIPSVGINLPIVEANIVNGYWETSETTASHGVGSSDPGESGNMVIFAHARAGLFLPLKDIQKDSLIYVYAKQKRYVYRVKDIQFVTPDKVQYISQTPDTRLTLFTCSGFLDEKRMIVEAKPI